VFFDEILQPRYTKYMIDRIRPILATLVTPAIFAAFLSWGLPKDIYFYFFVSVYLTIFVVTLPVYLHLRKMNGLKLPPIMFGTFIIGMLSGIILLFLVGTENVTFNGSVLVKGGRYTLPGIWHEIRGILFMSLFGACIGLVWWLIAKAGSKNTVKSNVEA